MRSPRSTVQLIRLGSHILLALALLTLIRLLRQHHHHHQHPFHQPASRPPSSSSNSSSGSGPADPFLLPDSDLIGLYVDAKTSLFGLLLVHLPWLLSLGGVHDAAEMVRGAGAGASRQGDVIGLETFEQAMTVVSTGVWSYRHVLLLLLWQERASVVVGPTAAGRLVAGTTGAAAGLSFVLVLLHGYQLWQTTAIITPRSGPVVVDAIDDDGEKVTNPPRQVERTPAALPVPPIVDADLEVALAEPGRTQKEGAKAEAIILRGTLTSGVLLGLGLVVGLQAAAITAVLGYQPAVSFLPIVACSIPFLLFPSALSTPRLAATLSAVLLLWYRSAVTYALDERGAPTCGLWDPHASDAIRHLAPVLCALARGVYYLSWVVLGGLTWLLIDLYVCLSDNADADDQDHEEQADRLDEELALVVRATVGLLLAPVRQLSSTCLSRPDGPIHLV